MSEERSIAQILADVKAGVWVGGDIQRLADRVAELETDALGECLSNTEIVSNCNELARTFYKMQGYEVGPRFRFYLQTHPQELGCWNMAMAAYEHVNGSEVGDALCEMIDDQREEKKS